MSILKLNINPVRQNQHLYIFPLLILLCFITPSLADEPPLDEVGGCGCSSSQPTEEIQLDDSPLTLSLEFDHKMRYPNDPDGEHQWDVMFFKWTATNHSNHTLQIPIFWRCEGPTRSYLSGFKLLPHAYLVPPDSILLLSGNIKYIPQHIEMCRFTDIRYLELLPNTSTSGKFILDAPLQYPRFVEPYHTMTPGDILPRSVFEYPDSNENAPPEVKKTIHKTSNIYMVMHYLIVTPERSDEITPQTPPGTPSRIKIAKVATQQDKRSDDGVWVVWHKPERISVSNVLEIEVPLPEPVTLYYDPTILEPEGVKDNLGPLYWKP